MSKQGSKRIVARLAFLSSGKPEQRPTSLGIHSLPLTIPLSCLLSCCPSSLPGTPASNPALDQPQDCVIQGHGETHHGVQGYQCPSAGPKRRSKERTLECSLALLSAWPSPEGDLRTTWGSLRDPWATERQSSRAQPSARPLGS